MNTSFGEPAVDAVATVVSERAGPLDPGLIVCSGPFVALALRQALALRAPSGFAGVEVTTSSRLLARWSEPSLAASDRRWASSAELQVAIRAELSEDPGMFASVAGHHTTEERLLRLDAELYGVPAETRAQLASAGALIADSLRVLRGASRRLAPRVTATEAAELALERLSAVGSGQLGPIVVYLPDPRGAAEGRLMAMLGRRDDCTVIVGHTGWPDVDIRLRRRLAGWGMPVAEPAPGSPPGPSFAPGRRLEVADPGDEVRFAIRELTAHASAGEPLASMGLLYTSTDPYADLIEEQLRSAEIPFTAVAVRPVSSSVAGRLLLRLLDLVDSTFERAAVITMVAAAPVRTVSGQLAPATEWDTISRLAGVVDGDDWDRRLRRYEAGLRRDAEAVPDGARDVEDLRLFVEKLQAECDGASRQSWRAWADWSDKVLTRLTGGPTGWPQAEARAWDLVLGVLEELRDLDGLSSDERGSVDRDAFSTMVASRLDEATIPALSDGEGLMVAPLHTAVGINFDRVAVVGLNEGVFPRAGREDSLLSDQVRAQAHGLLLARSEQLPMDVAAVTAVVAAARGRAALTMSRGDLRTRRTRSWPPGLNHLVDPEGSVVVDSHHRGMVDHGRPASVAEFRLRSLMVHTDSGQPAGSHPAVQLDPFLSRALGLARDRSRPRLTAATGRLPAGAVDPTVRPLSPTALEAYAACPRRYLLERVLRLAEDERPERNDEIGPRERGSLVHAVLERFVGEAIDDDCLPEPDVEWDADAARRLESALDTEVDSAAGQGLTGGRVQTEILRRELRSELLRFLPRDNEVRRERQSRPFAVEYSLGMEAGRPLVFRLGDGREVLLRGIVDRVDLTDDGGVLVIDYKGGSKRPFQGLAADPLNSGRRLQLPLYGRLLADELGRDGPRTAAYWLTKEDSLIPVELSPELDGELDRHVGAALDGIEAGLFPGVPGGRLGWPRLTFENCSFCALDRICPTDRQREWDAVSGDSVLQPVELLLGREES